EPPRPAAGDDAEPRGDLGLAPVGLEHPAVVLEEPGYELVTHLLDPCLGRRRAAPGRREGLADDEVEEGAVFREELFPCRVLAVGAAPQEEDVLLAHGFRSRTKIGAQVALTGRPRMWFGVPPWFSGSCLKVRGSES